jgi:uncharacterized protein with ParB-like and HNH nuclease domain
MSDGGVQVEKATTLGIQTPGLGACLASNVLKVPRYQRAFSWEDEDVNNFLVDINTAYSSGAAEYFMGSVVMQGDDQQFEVVDGQQRLTTAFVFIAAVRDFLRTKKIAGIPESLETQFLSTKDTWTQAITSKLSLSVYDDAFFTAAILKAEAVPTVKESHERLAAARARCLKFVEAIADQHSNWQERLQGLVTFLQHKVRVIQVVVPSHANAFVIFETLNARGKDLSASDLLKNYLFGKAGDKVDQVQANWNQMLGTLDAHGGEEIVITYIRQLWSATHEIAREKDLFVKIKDRIGNQNQALKFSEDLHDRARHYAATLSSADPLWQEHGANAKQIIESLNTLKVERYRPALLALLNTFKGAELVEAMRYILNGSVRYLIAVGAGGGTLESAYSLAAQQITQGKIKTAKEFAKEMTKAIPSDTVFENAFKTARVSKSHLARYYLIALENHSGGSGSPELVPNSNVNEVNLEHVLPENPKGEWPGLSADTCEAYYRRIGNMALLSTTKNSKIGNLAFDKKKPTLHASGFQLTKQIAAEAEWGPAEIEKRQSELAALAVKVWHYKA